MDLPPDVTDQDLLAYFKSKYMDSKLRVRQVVRDVRSWRSRVQWSTLPVSLLTLCFNFLEWDELADLPTLSTFFREWMSKATFRYGTVDYSDVDHRLKTKTLCCVQGFPSVREPFGTISFERVYNVYNKRPFDSKLMECPNFVGFKIYSLDLLATLPTSHLIGFDLTSGQEDQRRSMAGVFLPRLEWCHSHDLLVATDVPNLVHQSLFPQHRDLSKLTWDRGLPPQLQSLSLDGSRAFKDPMRLGKLQVNLDFLRGKLQPLANLSRLKFHHCRFYPPELSLSTQCFQRIQTLVVDKCHGQFPFYMVPQVERVYIDPDSFDVMDGVCWAPMLCTPGLCSMDPLSILPQFPRLKSLGTLEGDKFKDLNKEVECFFVNLELTW